LQYLYDHLNGGQIQVKGECFVKKAVVLGATGGMGVAIVHELITRGIEVTAFARNEEKLTYHFGAQSLVNIFPGNVFSKQELNDVVKGNDVIFHAINIPYADWQKKLSILTKNIINVTKENSAKLAIVDNIYSYGKNPGKKVQETTSKTPHTKKGKIRLEMEKLYKTANIPYVIAHFPDFYGPYVENSLLNFTLRDMAKNQTAQFVGNQTIAREHIFTPDGAKALVQLAENENAYYQNWNIPAYDVITGEEIISIVRELIKSQSKVSTVTKNMLRFVGIFNKQMREFVEMQYLNEDPVILDGEKYERIIGPLPKTNYEEGIRKTLESMVLENK